MRMGRFGSATGAYRVPDRQSTPARRRLPVTAAADGHEATVSPYETHAL